MKLTFVLLAAATVESLALLSRGSPTEEIPTPRKLSLFTRTAQVKNRNCGGKFPCDDSFGTLFASGASPVQLTSTGQLSPSGSQQMVQQQQAPAANADCHPKCTWSCGSPDCDEVCDPVCAPPQCETACSPINLAACRQRCDPPKCAIVCPTQHCEHGGCPACKTVCAPPKCTTECAEQCESKCSEPQCTWKCNPGKCEKPRCSLRCGGAKACGLDGNLNARPPPFADGMTVLAKGLAASDPTSLTSLAAKGPEPAKQVPPSMPSGISSVGAPAPALAPVR